MIYILDTDLFTFTERRDSADHLRLRSRIAQLPPDDELVTSIITYEEQTRGWLAYAAKSRQLDHQVKAYARLKRHLEAYMNISVLDFDPAAAQTFQTLTSQKLRVGTSDLKIASIALANNATLLSRNLGDFQKIPRLRVEDWTRD